MTGDAAGKTHENRSTLAARDPQPLAALVQDWQEDLAATDHAPVP